MPQSPHPTPEIRSVKIAKREVRNLASIRRRVDGGQLTGRNDAATWATVDYKVRALQAFFAQAEETPETERLYDRFNALERWSVGLPS
jgi:hypothetical protein